MHNKKLAGGKLTELGKLLSLFPIKWDCIIQPIYFYFLQLQPRVRSCFIYISNNSFYSLLLSVFLHSIVLSFSPFHYLCVSLCLSLRLTKSLSLSLSLFLYLCLVASFLTALGLPRCLLLLIDLEFLPMLSALWPSWQRGEWSWRNL